jgi:hypothetical protein
MAIPPLSISCMWDDVELHISRALAHTRGELKAETLKRRLIENDAILLVVLEHNNIIAAIVAEIVETDGPRVCHIIACGGHKADLWLDKWYSVIIPIAKEQGCTRLSLTGRKGWVKKLSKYGLSHAYTTLDQDI